MTKERQTPAARRIAQQECASILAEVIEPVREVARSLGYAITVHGSLARDIDLVAVPWVEWAKDPGDLVNAIRVAICSVLGSCYLHTQGDGTEKPHGRRAFTLTSQVGSTWFDLSVMPRFPETEEQD